MWRRGAARFWPKMDYIEIENLIVPFAVDTQGRELLTYAFAPVTEGDHS